MRRAKELNGERLKITTANKVLWITIDHPPANTLDSRTLRELERALAAAEDDPGVKAIVITGAGKFFAAGADIKEFNHLGSKIEARRFAETGQRLMDTIEGFGKPVIAKINGYCLGGGLELAMACHIRIAAESAQLGLPELRLGLIPGYGGTQRLPRLTNREKALELILTGNSINGKEACRIGLVSRAVPLEMLDGEAERLAAGIAEKSSPAVRAVLRAVRLGLEEGMARGLHHEAEAFGERFESEDAKIGIQAFLDKRKPEFKDR